NDEAGNPTRTKGTCEGVKAIGWFIEEYGVAQISMNITNTKLTSVHKAFEECRKSANARGMRVTGSELVGMAPLQAFLDAGRYYLEQQERSTGISEAELIKIAVKSMGMDDLAPFDASKKIIEYSLADANDTPLLNMDLKAFANETASESMVPGGGSISAYVATLGISLGTMVANLSSHKRGWDDRWEEFSNWAAKGQSLKNQLLVMVDEDTNSFNKIILAMRLPKGTNAEKAARSEAIQAATKYAIEVPFKVMELSLATFEVLKAMVEEGNPNSVTDAGVGALCVRAAIRGAFMNVKVNAGDLKDKDFVNDIIAKGEVIEKKAAALEAEIMELVSSKI
ncbi:MAG: glutamate formiminotransferase/formiminotetrahydrofolate cyclodeaminase, partial [Saprospiraceae bacterium]